jgi:hypothetical protein
MVCDNDNNFKTNFVCITVYNVEQCQQSSTLLETNLGDIISNKVI